ncbi:uncharacterized protein LOC109719245 [Ananas comosus]|uniref:Uncharacterized protein LOC109719245 n=2 Tax=Ananas comosus TaxID=4615 RepID=A0A6P5FZA6_ANACO|nr:uncharacterized protein LOC109719245 [Ananas comosus]CAD1817706.1 unnamed protein product [Ananas comosus var. bracteatus]
MKVFWKKVKRIISRNSIYVAFLFICVMCLLFLLNSSLPEVSTDTSTDRSSEASSHCVRLKEMGLCELGNMMIAMLPDDLAFTVFVPSQVAFEHVLKLRTNDSLTEQNVNNTYAIVSRVMGFSSIPRHLPSEAVPLRKEISYDSVSGFRLYAWKDFDGTLVVNGVRSECVDIRKGEIIAHVMKGVIMDAEFEQSFSPDYED